MNKEVLKRLKEKVKNLPSSNGVYSMLDRDGNVIYIGKAKNLKNRVSSYFSNVAKPEKVQQMVNNVFDFEYTVVNSEVEALNLESNLIHSKMPFYNILLKDGKAFPYIRIDNKADYPVVEVTRRVKKDKALYFGPYFSKINIWDLTDIIQNTFKLRNCRLKIRDNKKAKRPCLNYHIGICFAPCIHNVSKEEYKQEVEKVIAFLKGDLSEAKELLTSKMLACSKLEQFERALVYKQSIEKIEALRELNITELPKFIDLDVFGYYTNGQIAALSLLCIRGGKMVGSSHFNIIDASLEEDDVKTNFVTQYYIQQKLIPSEIVIDVEDSAILSQWLTNQSAKKVETTNPTKGIKKKLLDLAKLNAKEHCEKSIQKEKLFEVKTIGALTQLKEILQLKSIPYRIEGYDISNLGGTNTVASMVVFENGLPKKTHYRKFKINVEGQNDFESMRQVITRRMSEKQGEDISFRETPQLILIDGGKGQLGKAKEVLESLGVNWDIVSLAKREEEIYLPNRATPILLNRNNYGLKLLQNVRDESHRFAVTFQRSLRNNKGLVSTLEEIKLLGKEKIKLLYQHFKSLKAIKEANIEDLQQVKGIGKKLAENIYSYFHKNKID